MRIISVALLVGLTALASMSQAQSGSANYKLTSGTAIGGGGNSASNSAKLAGAVPITPGGVSSSSVYKMVGGVAAITLASKFITDVEESQSVDLLPHEFVLEQNYPNPFNPETVINFALPQSGQVRLDIYNVLGQRVRRLIDLKMPAGRHATTWDGQDEQGNAVASGVYFYTLVSGDNSASKKMLILK